MNFFIGFRQSILMIGFFILTLPIQMYGGFQGWVSGTGVDTGFCGTGTPCATFQNAFYNLWVNSPNFEVTAIDSGSYGGGGLTINAGVNVAKAYTIDGGEGNLACLTAQQIVIGGGGVNYAPGSIVLLRNLTLYGEGFAGAAIQLGSLSAGLTLIIENCRIYDYSPAEGIGVIDCQNPANLIIRNTIIEGNNGDAIIVNATGERYFSFNELAIKQNNGNAISIVGSGDPIGTPLVDISNSVITQNGGHAVFASGSNTSVNCLGNVLTSNGLIHDSAALGVVNSALIRISNNDIYNNYGFIDYLDQTGAKVITANDNRTGSNGVAPQNPNGSIQIQ